MAEKHIMKQHDLEPGFQVQLLDDTTPIDLTSAVEILFMMKSRKGLKAIGAMTVADQSITANRGVVRYDWVLGDTDTASVYNAEIQVSWPPLATTPGYRPQTFPADKYMTVDIQKDLGPPPPPVTAVIILPGGGNGLITATSQHHTTFQLTGGDSALAITAVATP